MFTGGDASGYEFSARPRVVDSRPKFRDPYGQTMEYIPQNIMHDRRIARGSTHASMVIPAGNHPDALFLEKKKEQQRRIKMQQEEDARRAAEEYARRDIKTPEPLPGRINLDVQTEPFVENLTDKPTEFEIGVQSDFYIDRPPTPLFVPQKTGEDAQTQVEKNVFEEDVYDFNDIVEPILSVLCYNVIEQAQMEVYEEHEFNFVDTRRKDFEKVRNLKLIEAQRLEAAETRRKQEVERRRNQVKARTLNRVGAHQKYTSRQIAKKFLANVCPVTLQLLEDQGTLVESLGVLLHEQAVPWLYDQTMRFLREEDLVDVNTEEVVEEALNYPAKAHRETVEQENAKKRQQEKEREEKQVAKAERKRKREEAKEAARKAEEMKKFQEDVTAEFVEGSDTKDKILIHDITDTDGNLLNTPVIGVVGGTLTQMAVVISTASQEFKEKVQKFVDREPITRFLVTYISQHMKADKFFVKMSRAVEKFIKEKEIKMSNIQKAKEEVKNQLISMLTDTDNGMISDQIRELVQEAESVGLNRDIVILLHRALVDIITKTPVSKEGNLAKLDPTIDKIKLTPPPENFDLENPNFRAIVRIRIPMEEVKDEESPRAADKSMEKDKKGKSKKTRDDLNKSNISSKSKEEPKPPKEPEEDKNKDENKEVELREAEIEDRALLVNPMGENFNVYVTHQAASRVLRRDIINCLLKNVPDFEDVDADDFATKAEEVANKLEQNWIGKHPDLPVFDFDLN